MRIFYCYNNLFIKIVWFVWFNKWLYLINKIKLIKVFVKFFIIIVIGNYNYFLKGVNVINIFLKNELYFIKVKLNWGFCYLVFCLYVGYFIVCCGDMEWIVYSI